MIVAGFGSAGALTAAARHLDQAGIGYETRTPVALPADEGGPSRIPRGVLAAGLLAASGAFGLQCYAAMVSYPQLIGGRPGFFWTSYLVWAVEAGVLAAIVTAFAGFMLANRLPRYWEPSDECDALRAATRDGWFLIAQDEAALGVLRAGGAITLEHVPG